MTIKEAKDIDMVSYLASMGYEPARVSGVSYWYHSPFRNETTPSFKVNRNKNRWYDFGEGWGGNLVDFMVKKDGNDIREILKKLSGYKELVPSTRSNDGNEKRIDIIDILSISSFALIRYYQSRRIHRDVAEQYLREVRYKNGAKSFYALGFKNDAGGYELRSSGFKGGSSPKRPTTIKNDAPVLAVFEGFFDFLSYITIQQSQSVSKRDFLVLNSTSFFEPQLPFMQTYSLVHLYLDNDNTGNKCSAMALATDANKFVDERGLYFGYNDLNDWHCHVGLTHRLQTQSR
jgi:hypothetical protein